MADDQLQQPNVDKDLDNLLDSALSDFDTKKTAAAAATAAGAKVVSPPPPASAPADSVVAAATAPLKAAGGPDESGPWTAEFAQMEEAMKKFMDDDPALQEQLSKIAQSASRAAAANTDEEFSVTLQETLENITKSIDQFQAPEGGAGLPGGMDDMARLLSAMGLGGGGGADGEPGVGGSGFLSMMQGMMQNLLSKELLYPALKDLTEKYPKWLDDNRATTSAEDLERYEKQLEIMKRVCATFDEEKDTDSADVKKERFDKVLKMMQDMHECGNPPAELVDANGEGIPGFPGAGGQVPDLPPPPPECNQQ